MMTSSAGLKEFADGDAALFSGNILTEDTGSTEDFELEFHRLLTESVNTSTFTIDSSTETFPVNVLTPKMTSSLPSESVKEVKFEEDPLSAVLNFEQQTSGKSETPKKRGRPPLLKFKTVNINKPVNSKQPLQSQSDEKEQHRHLQLRDRRSDSDFYSPLWIRGRGADREGLCPVCEPPVWLKIKQSAYWYHMNFFHGISATTGRSYKRPISYRFVFDDKSSLSLMTIPAVKVEGHCGNCLQWIPLATEYTGDRSIEILERSICFTSWFKHAQKCHYRAKEFRIPDDF